MLIRADIFQELEVADRRYFLVVNDVIYFFLLVCEDIDCCQVIGCFHYAVHCCH